MIDKKKLKSYLLDVKLTFNLETNEFDCTSKNQRCKTCPVEGYCFLDNEGCNPLGFERFRGGTDLNKSVDYERAMSVLNELKQTNPELFL